MAAGETAIGPNECRGPRNLMRGDGRGCTVVYRSDPCAASKGLTAPCRTSRTRVDPNRRQPSAQPVPKRKRSAMWKLRRCLPQAWLAILPRAASSSVMQGRSLLVLSRGWKVLSASLSSSFQLAEHVLDFYRLSFSLVPRFLASKNDEKSLDD